MTPQAIIALKYVACIALGYFMGSIPFGVIIARRTAHVNVMELGSKSTGTTNVLRTAGRKAAAIVFASDLLKGVLAVVFARIIMGISYLEVGDFGFGKEFGLVLAALAAVVGHNWSVFLKFRGGRGVTTFFGGMIALSWPTALLGGELFIISAFATRFVSLASLIAVVSTYALMILLTIRYHWPLEFLFYALVGTVVIVVMHRGNIIRLLSGSERRLGDKAEELQAPTPGEGKGKETLTGRSVLR
ncbi:MAG: glycerol-3-phosphate 1-O-acyltransferase PlsY [Dehalococcoidales bacterium]|nr:MAG: glycerol-3-phosphate 1-O-acyltransferase PlsY [Dehalococcoidales bacterium]